MTLEDLGWGLIGWSLAIELMRFNGKGKVYNF